MKGGWPANSTNWRNIYDHQFQVVFEAIRQLMAPQLKTVRLRWS